MIRICRETFMAIPQSPQPDDVPLQQLGLSSQPGINNLRPLSLRSPLDILLDGRQPDLPQASLLEHFEREPDMPQEWHHRSSRACILSQFLSSFLPLTSFPRGEFEMARGSMMWL